MKQQFEQIIDKLSPTIAFIKHYLTFGLVISLLLIYGYLVFQINSLIQTEPSADAVTERLKTVQRPRVDPTTLSKIQQLQDQNVQVKGLFDTARNNPFVE